MTIQDLGSLGELIAAVATVATLVYLAAQIRANTAALKVESGRAYRAAAAPMLVAIAQDGELARIFNRGLADFKSLDPEEQTRFAFVMGDIIGNAASRYREVTAGVLSEKEFESEKDTVAPFLKTPGGRQFWERLSGRFPAEFRDYVAREIL